MLPKAPSPALSHWLGAVLAAAALALLLSRTAHRPAVEVAAFAVDGEGGDFDCGTVGGAGEEQGEGGGGEDGAEPVGEGGGRGFGEHSIAVRPDRLQSLQGQPGRP